MPRTERRRSLLHAEETPKATTGRRKSELSGGHPAKPYYLNDPSLSNAERQRRVAALDQVRHSIEMEGLSVDPETLADGEKYAEGNITIEELVQRTRARYGLE